MTIYAVGDLQGCLTPLKQLLHTVNFNPAVDQLWSVGDIVNRGPESLEALRFCHQLSQQNAFRMVLGNHDLHLLAAARGKRKPSKKDTIATILNAPDRDELLHWLQQQPLLFCEQSWLVVHAGIPPQWHQQQALALAAEVQQVLQHPQQSDAYFDAMYGDTPTRWSDNLSGPARWRTITNYLTRMRFCAADGTLELHSKNPPHQPPTGYQPWYSHSPRATAGDNILFGHWAALEGKPCGDNLFPLDTGYVWGGPLRLRNLTTGEQHHQHPPAA